MLPAVPDLLEALKSRMAETIIPALPEDAVFAQEQAGLMLATLDWLIDVQADQYLYEVVENGDHLGLLDTLRGIAGDDEETGDAVGQPGPPADEVPVQAAHLVDLDDLRECNRRLKGLTGALYTRIGAHGGPDQVDRARHALAAVARRQERRERAFYRMTGFPVDAEDLGTVLRDQSPTT
ncbi:MAG: hypothetical protein JWP61_2382 [Friedmanniella sp.]|jgi:hypothetical protein|nr:hypothetical protein [Friedmanniella sp.]